MKLDVSDVTTICSYIKGSRPEYAGPIFIDLTRLEQLHMTYSGLVAQMSILKAMDSIAMMYARPQRKGGN